MVKFIDSTNLNRPKIHKYVLKLDEKSKKELDEKNNKITQFKSIIIKNLVENVYIINNDKVMEFLEKNLKIKMEKINSIIGSEGSILKLKKYNIWEDIDIVNRMENINEKNKELCILTVKDEEDKEIGNFQILVVNKEYVPRIMKTGAGNTEKKKVSKRKKNKIKSRKKKSYK